MGTKVQSKSYLPGYHSMRDLNEDSNSFNWPLYYGDKTLSNEQYYNSFLPKAVADAYSGYDKDVVKQTMLEHEAIFKNQVYELHRLYRIQRDLMDEIKRKELHQNRIPFETSMSSSPLASRVTSEDGRKCNIPSFPLSSSISARPSISGAEDMHSPFSPLKGNPAQAGSFPSQNGSCSKSKDIEVLESRPTKVRRKMFDLQLPADEYIDTEEGEQFRNIKSSGMSSYVPNGIHKIAPEGDVENNGCEGVASRSNSNLRSTNGLADLNEPIQVEETNAPAFVDLLGTSCHGEIRGHEVSGRAKSQFLGMPKENSENHLFGINNGTTKNFYMGNNENGRAWFPHVVLEAGKSRSDLRSASHGFHPEKLSASSQPIQAPLSKARELPIFQSDQSKIDLWRERTNCGLDRSERSRDISTYNHPDSVMASHMPSLYPVAPTSDLAKSWSQSVSSWENPSSSLNQRSIQLHSLLNSSDTLSKSSQSLAQSQNHGMFGNLWHLTSNSRASSGFGREFPNRNGFYHGSSSGSKELQVTLSSTSHDYLNCSNGTNNAVSEHFAASGSSKYYNGSNCMDVKFAKDMNLNVMLSTSSSNEAVSQRGLGILEEERRKQDDHFVSLPWLRSKPACKNEATDLGKDSHKEELSFFQSSTNQLSIKSDACQLFYQNIKSLSSSNDVVAKRAEVVGWPNNKKILGFPIFEKPPISENESESVETNNNCRLLDINLPCDAASPETSKHSVAEDPVMEKLTDARVSVLRHHIDLNSCLSEDEASLTPFVPSSKVKTTTEIDLEAPAVPETEEDLIHGEENHRATPLPFSSPQRKTEQPQDDLVKTAAEAIVDISSFAYKSNFDVTTSNSPDASLPDPLNWFADIASFCGNDIRFGGDEDSSSEAEEVDYFESMTLKLTETKEEDYMPKPLVPDNLQLEETGGSNLLTARPRRGQARRGRQRRDFQRDILPGLTSLSRHEVTEDLQTFGGMMRATGHSWQSGLGRRNAGRNGCGRGRRRSVASPPPVVAPIVVAAIPACTQTTQPVNNIDVGLEYRSLTGWGKTTRRPRRQRCPPGNPQSIPLC